MRYVCSLVRRAGLFLGLSVVTALVGFNADPVVAKDKTQATESQVKTAPAQADIRADVGDRTESDNHWTVRTRSSAHRAKRSYFIEFRARSAASYGHMYVLYGRVNDRDEIIESRIAGLHPAGDAANCYNCSLFNWTVGHLIPVPSETGASDGDLEEKYVTARYRVRLDAAQYKMIDTYIRARQADSPTWNALWNNCVDFGRDIAKHLGLKAPGFIWLEPQDFVTELRKLNGVEKEQLPLRDASSSSRASVHAVSLRAPQSVGRTGTAKDE